MREGDALTHLMWMVTTLCVFTMDIVRVRDKVVMGGEEEGWEKIRCCDGFIKQLQINIRNAQPHQLNKIKNP